jgi:hypothetical protein
MVQDPNFVTPLRTSLVTKLGDPDEIRGFFSNLTVICLCKKCKVLSLLLIRVGVAGSVPDFVTRSGSALFCVSGSGSGFKIRIQEGAGP